MGKDNTVGALGDDLRTQASNWLQLMELAGTTEVVLASTPTGRPLERRRPPDVADAPGVSGDRRPGVPSPRGEAAGGSLAALTAKVVDCDRCGLHGTRTKVVFGEGDPRSRLIFVGGGPGRDEDISGRPFVGRAGMLLTRIIEAMGLTRSDVYITNIVKCRPPGNRNPEPDEISECLPYLEKQIELIEPEVICTLGLVATQTLTGLRRGITSMRGRFYEYRGIKLMPTFHPAACLRKPATKKDVWKDIQEIMKVLDLPVGGGMRHGAGKNKH